MKSRWNVRITRITQLRAFAHRPATQIAAVFSPQRGFLLHGAQPQGEVLLRRVVVVAVFEVAVVQVSVAQRDGLHVTARIVPPRRADGKGLLPNPGQVAQQVFGILALLVEVEFHVVEARQPQHRQFVALRKTRLDLELSVDIVGQERQADHLEEQLQVGLPQRKEIGGFPADMSAAAQPDFRRSQRRLEGLLFGIPVPQPEIQHGTQRPGTVGRESPGIEADLADQVGIDDAHRTARGSLRGEMVDIGDLDAVHVEFVLRRASAAHDQVVAIAHGRERHAGIGAHDARDVAVGAGTLLDLPQADHLQSDGTFGRGPERRGHDGHGFELRGVLLQLDLDKGRGRRHDVFRRNDAFVAHRRSRQAVNAGPYAPERKASGGVGRDAPLLLPDRHDRRIGHGAPRQTSQCI